LISQNIISGHLGIVGVLKIYSLLIFIKN